LLFVILFDPLLNFLRLHEVGVVENVVAVKARHPVSFFVLSLILQRVKLSLSLGHVLIRVVNLHFDVIVLNHVGQL
jgi:hypothetical protein